MTLTRIIQRRFDYPSKGGHFASESVATTRRNMQPNAFTEHGTIREGWSGNKPKKQMSGQTTQLRGIST